MHACITICENVARSSNLLLQDIESDKNHLRIDDEDMYVICQQSKAKQITCADMHFCRIALSLSS